MGSFHFSILSQQAVTHKNTKDAGAGNKEALPSKSPHIQAGGLSLAVDGFWRPVWFASDFGSKQRRGSHQFLCTLVAATAHPLECLVKAATWDRCWWLPSPQTKIGRALPELDLVDSTSFVSSLASFLSHTHSRATGLGSSGSTLHPGARCPGTL